MISPVTRGGAHTAAQKTQVIGHMISIEDKKKTELTPAGRNESEWPEKKRKRNLRFETLERHMDFGLAAFVEGFWAALYSRHRAHRLVQTAVIMSSSALEPFCGDLLYADA